MFELYDRVLHKPSGKACFVIDVDEGDDGAIYGVEAADQEDADWFYWAEEHELERISDD